MHPGPLRALAVLAAVLLAPPPARAAENGGAAAYRLGVVTFYNPRLMYMKYQPLVDYLTETTGSRWQLAISNSYESTVRGLCDGQLTVAYLGPLTYVRARELCGAVPVVKLVTHGKPTFESVIVVRDDSDIRSLSDLRGKSFGFGSPLSTSSHIMPRAVLERAGLKPGADVQCRYFMHHESAARAVLMREVDAAGVRDIIADEFAKRGLRVLHRSEPLPNFPFVAGPKAPPAVMRDMVRALVIEPARDPAARARIASWDEELAGGFTHAAAEDFEPLRVLGERMFGAHWTGVPERALQCGGAER